MSTTRLERCTGEVVATRALGAYRHLSVVRPALPRPARPGQFVLLPPAPGPRVLSQSWWLAGARTEAGFGSTLEFVVPEAPDLPAPGEELVLTGPVGRGYGLPTTPVQVVVATQGPAGGAARWLTERLRGRGCTVHLLSCAADPEEHVDLVQARRTVESVVLTDPEGAAGALTDLATRRAAAVLYAVGPLSLSATVARVAARRDLVCQVSCLEVGADDRCGHGLCGACELPLSGQPQRAVRPCVDGPVLRGDQVRWGVS